MLRQKVDFARHQHDSSIDQVIFLADKVSCRSYVSLQHYRWRYSAYFTSIKLTTSAYYFSNSMQYFHMPRDPGMIETTKHSASYLRSFNQKVAARLLVKTEQIGSLETMREALLSTWLQPLVICPWFVCFWNTERV